jgi:hypothetical protein
MDGHVVAFRWMEQAGFVPRGDLECGAKDLGADELGHGEGRGWMERAKWDMR